MFSSSRLKSQIWLHYTSADEEKKVRCLYCGQKLSIANKSTCSLIRHLHKKHPKQHNILRKPHPESKYNSNVQESKKKDGYFYKKSISIKKQKEIDKLLAGGGKHELIPPEATLDKVANILGPNCDGYKVQFDDDDMVNVIVVEQENHATEEQVTQEDPLTLLLPAENEQNHQNLGPPELSQHLPKPKMYYASDKKGKPKSQVLVNEIKRSIKEKNLAIARYYDSKRKQEEELHFLRKKKLQLEIVERESKILKPTD